MPKINTPYWVNRLLTRFGSSVELVERTAPVWEEDSKFGELTRGVIDRSLLDLSRLYLIYQAFGSTRGVPGDVGEVGVFRGGTSLFLSRLIRLDSPERKLQLFDSFSGLPPPDSSRDGTRAYAGEFSGSRESVESLLREDGFTNFRTHTGWLRETMPQAEKEGLTWSFVHLDVDLYESVRSSLPILLEHTSSGGAIVLDDFGQPSTPGVRRAALEVLRQFPIRAFYLRTGQELILKL